MRAFVARSIASIAFAVLPLGAQRPAAAPWQNRVDYQLTARLAPASRTLRGSGWITYHNNSPDTLHELRWHLYQNLFRPEVRPSRSIEGRRVPETRGIAIQRLEVGGAPLRGDVDATLMRTPLASPLAPRDSMRLYLEWDYEIPRGAALRNGGTGRDFAIAQWYPQVAVYDDLHGWDAQPYRGRGEFYLEYGNWDVQLDIPADYVVAATGTLQQPHRVLDAPVRARLEATTGDSAVIVLAGGDSARRGGVKRWHFTARDVRDFALAASPNFIWRATRTRDGTLIQTFSLPEEERAWATAPEVARYTMERLGDQFGEYAYPQVSVVSGPVEGMEYPMLVFARPARPAEVIVHELAHQWFPMMVGSHETRDPFMDEGFATFAESIVLDDPHRPAAFAPHGSHRLDRMREYSLMSAIACDIPLATHADSAPNDLAYGLASYHKASQVLFMLRDVVGDSAFDLAVREYARRWRFQHPTPDDFIHGLESVTRSSLAWFWQPWVHETPRLDMGLGDLRQRRTASGWRAEMDITSNGTAAVPPRVRLTLADDRTRDVRPPHDAWASARSYTLVVDSLPARVTRVELDPDHMLLDLYRANDRWPLPPSELADASWMRDLRVLGAQSLIGGSSTRILPWVGRNDVDGKELGLRLMQPLGESGAELRLAGRRGGRSGAADGWMSLASPITTLLPRGLAAAQVASVDGRIGADLELQFGGAGIVDGSTPARFRLVAHAVRLDDSAYVSHGWERGTLAAIEARIRVPRSYGAGTVTTHVGSLDGRSFAQSSVELEANPALGAHAVLRLRAFAGTSAGRVPAQAELHVAQASPWEQWARAPHAIAGASHQRLWGGGGVIGAPADARAPNLAAVNSAVARRFGRYSVDLFADAAGVSGGADGGRLFSDAGIGVDIPVPFDARRVVRVAFPLLVSTAPAAAFRWAIVIGGR